MVCGRGLFAVVVAAPVGPSYDISGPVSGRESNVDIKIPSVAFLVHDGPNRMPPSKGCCWLDARLIEASRSRDWATFHTATSSKCRGGVPDPAVQSLLSATLIIGLASQPASPRSASERQTVLVWTHPQDEKTTQKQILFNTTDNPLTAAILVIIVVVVAADVVNPISSVRALNTTQVVTAEHQL